MKYKLLLIGKNMATINDFFVHMDNSFECLSCSLNFSDMTGHIKYYEPDAVVVCMNGENKDNISAITSFHFYIQKTSIPILVYADAEDYELFRKLHPHAIDLYISKPQPTKHLEENIIRFLNQSSLHNSKNQRTSEFDYSSYKSSLSHNPAPSKVYDYDTQQIINDLKSDIQMPDMDLSFLSNTNINGDRKRVMIIDDSPAMLKSIKEHLKQDYEVATAISGKIALKYLQNKNVDLILLDYEMPEINGPEVFQMLLDNPKTAQIPVIFLTGIKETSKIQKALSLKPQGYILKPVQRDILLEKIHDVLA